MDTDTAATPPTAVATLTAAVATTAAGYYGGGGYYNSGYYGGGYYGGRGYSSPVYGSYSYGSGYGHQSSVTRLQQQPLALVTIEAPSMELWDLAPATPCVPTSTIMAQGPMG